MLLLLSTLADYAAMTVSLWLAAYLLARGFHSRLTWRAIIILAALAAAFFSAFVNLYDPDPRSSIWRAGCLTVAIVVWHDLVAGLAPASAPHRWVRVWAVYALGVVNLGMLWAAGELFPGVRGDFLWTAQARPGLIYLWHGSFLALVFGAIFYAFYRLWRAGAGPYHRYFFLATCLPAAIVIGYLAQALPVMPPMPRLLQDGLMLSGVGLFGYAVARHHAMVERRTSVQDFPLSALTVLGLTSLYALLALQRDFTVRDVAAIAVLAVLTHSGVDLLREFLDRLLHRQDAALRQRLRRLARNVVGERTLEANLHRALALLCHRWNASGGFVALRDGAGYRVTVTLRSRPAGSRLDVTPQDDIFRLEGSGEDDAVWLAPGQAAGQVVALLGLERPRGARRTYTERELDALAEAGDWLGLLVVTHQRQAAAQAQLTELVEEAQARAVGLQAGTADLLTALEIEPPDDLVKAVEAALRHLDDFDHLGSSPLVAALRVVGDNHLVRGKAVRAKLLAGIECLRPAGARPREPLPREWFSYVVLYDAYVEGIHNREIQNRLYTSQTVFHRTRRKAVRALARALVEPPPTSTT